MQHRKGPFFSSLGLLSLCLWIIGAAVLTWWFIQGNTMPGTDGRTAVVLSSGERAIILKEMRQLLQAVHGVVTGMRNPDQIQGRKQAATAAGSGGMKMASDVNPALMLKLPLSMKQIGMSVHRAFDDLEAAITSGATTQEVLQGLSTITSRCTACHEMFQIKEG